MNSLEEYELSLFADLRNKSSLSQMSHVQSPDEVVKRPSWWDEQRLSERQQAASFGGCFGMQILHESPSRLCEPPKLHLVESCIF